MRIGSGRFRAGLIAFFSFAAIAAAVPESASSSWTVAAVAADAQCIVLRDAHGHAERFGVGASIGSSDWRVARITGTTAWLQSTRRIDGRALEMKVVAGAPLDLDALKTASAGTTPTLRPAAVSARAVRAAH
ncbi:MAG TPA: hypothetical protein VF132_01330 [Rudaea sp.]